MGRKSSEKKRRRIEKQKDKKQKKPSLFKRLTKATKSTKTTKATKATKPAKTAKVAKPSKSAKTDASKPDASKLKKKRQIQIPSQKIFGGVLAAILLTFLLVIGTELFQKAFKPTPLAELLPEKETVAFVEMNTNFEHTQLVKARNLLSTTAYSVEETTAKLEERLSIDVKKDILPWLGRQVGVAELMANPAAENPSLSSVYFLEAISQSSAKDFLKTIAENNLSELTETTEKKQKFYEFTLRYPGENRSQDQTIHATFIDEYLTLSPSIDAIKLLTIDTEKVETSEKYEEIQNFSPINKVAFVFMNFDHSPDVLLQKYGVLTGSSTLNSAIQPFAELFNSEGASLMAKDDYFEVESFMSLDDPYLKGNKYVTSVSNYNADLTQYVTADMDVFWGGVNIEKQLKRLVALLSEGNQSTTQIFEGVLQNYTEKYFGSNISMEKDIYPLIQNEFALTMKKKDDKDKDIYTLILELDNPADDALKIQKLANNFISSGAVFEPHIEEHELPDGTIAKEIVATPEELIKSESSHEEIVVYEMETESKSWGVYYAISNSKAIISTDKDTLTSSLDLILNKKENSPSLKNSPIYTNHIEPSLQNSDEVSYFKVTTWWPASPFIKSLSAGKEYFSNGVMAYYYIYVE